MPLRAYVPRHRPCPLCGQGFEVMQKAGEAPLSSCPRCGQEVDPREATPVSVARTARKPSVSEAKAAGFKVLKRTCDGSFEQQ